MACSNHRVYRRSKPLDTCTSASILISAVDVTVLLKMSIPIEIARAGVHDVKIRWEDGHESVYPARELRLACPCAGCVDEITGTTRLIANTIPHDVHPLKVEPVGRYAITIQWSDGHRTGIYSFEKLRKRCPCRECRVMGGQSVMNSK